MNKGFYAKLALNNIKTNSKVYIPYLLTCVGTFMMYFIMYTMSVSPSLSTMKAGGALATILWLGTWIVALFSVIFLFYTNSFLIKRRIKEFGLFNILGMEKKHLGRVMLYETLYTALITFVGGTGLGVLLSKLLEMLLTKLMRGSATMVVEFSGKALVTSLLLFAAIFTLTLLVTLGRIGLSKPVELLHGSSTGEKEPKGKWLIALLGAACLGTGYYLAVTVTKPISAINLFFIAVILVIFGTYFLFTSGSIKLLKFLKSRKGYYYKTNHFTTVSGMLYRMKQNAAGLGTICILSTMVLVMISSTVSLNVGADSSLEQRYPTDFSVYAPVFEDADHCYADETEISDFIYENLKSHNVAPSDITDVQLTHQMNCVASDKGDGVIGVSEDFYSDAESAIMLTFVSVSDYNKALGENVTLAEDEALLCDINKPFGYDTVTFGTGENALTFKAAKTDKHVVVDADGLGLSLGEYYAVIPDDTFSGKLPALIQSECSSYSDYRMMTFNTPTLSAEEQIALEQELRSTDFSRENGIQYDGGAAARENFYAMYGGLLFLGLFLGTLFTMATILIIYYKQVSEGYEDRERFAIMQKVGMSRAEVRRSIHSQVLTVFFLPLLTAGVHIVFAFNEMNLLLRGLGLTSTSLFIIATVITFAVFAVMYGVIYLLTARVYYKIVERAA